MLIGFGALRSSPWRTILALLTLESPSPHSQYSKTSRHVALSSSCLHSDFAVPSDHARRVSHNESSETEQFTASNFCSIAAVSFICCLIRYIFKYVSHRLKETVRVRQQETYDDEHGTERPKQRVQDSEAVSGQQ